MTHDGDLINNNNCALEALLKTTIMSTYIPANMPVPVWSACSVREFNDAVKYAVGSVIIKINSILFNNFG